MERKTVMVKEYATHQAFNTDEQKLSREGWSVEPTAAPTQPNVFARMRARFMRTPTPSNVVVTYTRKRFS